MMRSVLFFFLAFSLFPALSWAQNDFPPKRTQLSGRVVDPAGRPIDGALIDLGGSLPPQGNGVEPFILATDSLGRFYFDSALVNGYIRVRSFGYIPYVKRLKLTAPKAALTIRMQVDTSVANTCTRLCDLVYRRRTARKSSEIQSAARQPIPPDSSDVIEVYRAVLDSLLSLRGESPRLIVLPDSTFGGYSFCTRRPCEILPPHRTAIDSATLRAFDADRHRRAVTATPAFSYRIPIVLQSDADRNELMRLGVALGQNNYAPGMHDVEGFWRSFRQIYPGAWGTTWLSRVFFGGSRDAALVHVMHVCGSGCRSAEIVYLRKQLARWRIEERIPVPQYSQEGWHVAPLRYIGEGGTHAQQEIALANARRAARADSIRLWSAPRRVHGKITHWTSGLPIENAILAVHFGPADSIRMVRSNARGEYLLENPPIGPAMLEVRCAEPRRGRHDGLIGFNGIMGAPSLYVWPAADTAFDIRVRDISPCWRRYRFHRLDVAGELAVEDSDSAPAGSDVEAVYALALAELAKFYGDPKPAFALRTAMSCATEDECDLTELDSLVAKEVVFSETVTNFLFANERSVPLPRKVLPRTRLITQGERVFLFSQAASRMSYSDAGPDSLFWRAFRETHPGSRGIATLSRIGFNERRTEALVRIAYEAAGEVRPPQYLILKKKNGFWRAISPAGPGSEE